MKSWITLLTLSLASLGHGDEVRRRQEEISRAFYQRLGQLATRAEHQQSESRAGSGRNYGGFAPWQSAFSAANDAFKVFQRYETLRNIQRKKPLSITNDRPRAFADDQKKNQFIAFEAVPNVLTSDIEEDLPVRIELIKDEPIIEYIPFDSNVLKNSQPSTQFDLNLSTPVATTTPLLLTTTPLIVTTTTTTTTTIKTTSTTTASTTTASTTTSSTTKKTTKSTTTASITTTTTNSFSTTTTTTISTITPIKLTTTSTTSSTITVFTPSTVINHNKLNELIDEIFVPHDTNLDELLDDIFVTTPTATSTTSTTTSPTVIATTSIFTTTKTINKEKTTAEKPRTLVDLILTNVFKLTSDGDSSSQTTNLWELAEKYVPASTISSKTSTSTLTTTSSTTTMTTTGRLSTTNTKRTTTTSTTSTPSTRKDHSTSRNQNTKEQIESRGFPVKVVIDPHGLEFYFPDVLNLLLGSI